jgi:hypothetical protein
MSLRFADPCENMSSQRLQELLQRERYERDAARRRLFAGVVFCIRAVIRHCRDFKSFRFLRTSEPDEQSSVGDRTAGTRASAIDQRSLDRAI